MQHSGATYLKKPGINPFPGLRSFSDSESHLFFGREKHISDVRNKLEFNHFVAVVGTSGTGKSSLIRAGLLPTLGKEQNKSGADLWKLVTITPGNTPVHNLANALGKKFEAINGKTAEIIRDESLELLHASSLGLVQTMRSLLKEGERLLLLIDQFEEVFRFSEEKDRSANSDHTQFVQILIDTVRQRDVPVYALLTLRSDFLGDCIGFEGLPEAINDGHYLVPRMNAQELKRAISGPIDYAGGKISPRLIQHINQNLGHNVDQLPVLQHAMMRTWEYWQKHEIGGEPIDLKHFEAIGGLENALSSHADEAFDELTPGQQLLAQHIFKCLTTKKENGRGIRRPLALRELAQITEHTEQDVLECLKPFRMDGRSFILPGEITDVNQNTIFDISHESLMRGWKRLSRWVDEETDSSELYLRLCAAADLHIRGAAALWRNPELQLALDWKGREKPTRAWAELYSPLFEDALDFIGKSQNAFLDEQKKQRKRSLAIRSFIAAFIIVVTALAAWALVQTDVAKSKTAEAEGKSQEALDQKNLAERAREDAITASEEANIERNRAEEQASLAQQQKQRAESERIKAEIAARRAITGEEQALTQKKLADQKTREAELQRLQADSARQESTRLRLIATSQKLAYESEQVSQNPELAGLLAIESYNLAFENGGRTNDGTLYAAAAKAMKELAPELSSVVLKLDVEALQISISGNLFSVIDRAGRFLRFNTADFRLSSELKTDLNRLDINTGFIDKSGSFAFGLNDFSLCVFDSNSATNYKKYEGHTGLVRDFIFSEPGRPMVSVGRDGRVIEWDNTSSFDEISLDIKATLLCPFDSKGTLVVGCQDGSVYRMNLTSNEMKVVVKRQGVRVEALAVSESADLIAIGFSDGETHLYSLSGKFIKKLSGKGIVEHLVIDNKNDILIIATSSKKLSLYTLSNLTTLPIDIAIDRPIKSLTYSDKSGHLYVYCDDLTVQQFPVQTESLITELRSKINRNLSKEEWETFLGKDIPYPFNDVKSEKSK